DILTNALVRLDEPAGALGAGLTVIEVRGIGLGIGVGVGERLGEPGVKRLTVQLLLGGGAVALSRRPALGRGEALVERVVGAAVDQRVLGWVLAEELRISGYLFTSGSHEFSLPR